MLYVLMFDFVNSWQLCSTENSNIAGLCMEIGTEQRKLYIVQIIKHCYCL